MTGMPMKKMILMVLFKFNLFIVYVLYFLK